MGRDFGVGDAQAEFGAGLVGFAADVAEGEVGLPGGGPTGAGDGAHFLAVVKEFIAAHGEGWQGGGQPEAAEFAGDAAEAVHAVDDFLADVAAFVVNDGAAFDAAFEGEIGFIHVSAVARDAGFDAGGFEGGPAGGAAPGLFGGGDEFIGHGTQGIVGDEEVEAGGIEAREVDEIQIAKHGVGDFDGGVPGGGDFDKYAEGAHDGGGGGALHAEQTVMRGGVHELDIVGHNIAFQPGGDGGGEAGFKIEQEFLGQAGDVEVGLHFAFEGGEGGVAALAGGEFFDVVGHLAVEEAGAVGADEAEAATKAEIQHAGALAQSVIFHGGITVIGHGWVAGDRQKPRAEALVKFLQH